MKNVIALFSLLMVTTTFIFAQNDSWTSSGWGGKKVKGEGDVVTESRSVTGFKGVESGIAADVYIKQSNTFKVTIEGQKNILALLKTDLKGDMLKITFEKGYSVQYQKPLKVYVEAPNFQMLGMSGSGNVKAQNDLSGSDLMVRISGSGNFDLDNVKYTHVNFEVSGSGDIDVSGESEAVRFDVSGSGDIKAGSLKSKNVKCHVSGSGNINCNATKAIDAHISGSGDIRYSGKPESVKSKVSGSGDINAVK